MKRPTTPDWQRIVSDLLATKISQDDIARVAGLSVRAVRYLGSVQPFYYRGDSLLTLWEQRTGQARADAPMVEVVRGHRKGRGPIDRTPKAQSLPNWPPAQSPAVSVIKPRGRKAKVPA